MIDETPTFGCVSNAKRSGGSNTHHRQSKTAAKGQHQCRARRYLFQLKAKQKNGDGRRTRNKGARQTEYYDLTRLHITIFKPALDLLGISSLMIVGIDGFSVEMFSVARKNMAIAGNMFIMVVVMLALPGSNEHPGRSPHDDESLPYLKIGFSFL